MSSSSRAAIWVSRSSLSLGLVLALLGAMPAEPAHATSSTDQCLQAYEAGQRLRQAGDLVGAAGELLACGGPACPVRMQGDCQRWLDAVERSTPTVVFRVRRADDQLLTNVTVSIDGGAPRLLDGRALLINPGEHVMLFERAGYHPLRSPIFVTEGEKLEPREVTLQPLVDLAPKSSLLDVDAAELAHGSGDFMSQPAREPSRALSPWPLALGAVGLAGGAGFVVFGVRAKNGETDLDQCSPDCSQAQVDDVKRDYLWSNVSLGVGLAGVVGAGLLLLFDEPPADGSATSPTHAIELGQTTRWVTRF
jgi:hypothetical protein